MRERMRTAGDELYRRLRPSFEGPFAALSEEGGVKRLATKSGLVIEVSGAAAKASFWGKDALALPVLTHVWPSKYALTWKEALGERAVCAWAVELLGREDPGELGKAAYAEAQRLAYWLFGLSGKARLKVVTRELHRLLPAWAVSQALLAFGMGATLAHVSLALRERGATEGLKPGMRNGYLALRSSSFATLAAARLAKSRNPRHPRGAKAFIQEVLSAEMAAIPRGTLCGKELCLTPRGMRVLERLSAGAASSLAALTPWALGVVLNLLGDVGVVPRRSDLRYLTAHFKTSVAEDEAERCYKAHVRYLKALFEHTRTLRGVRAFYERLEGADFAFLQERGAALDANQLGWSLSKWHQAMREHAEEKWRRAREAQDARSRKEAEERLIRLRGDELETLALPFAPLDLGPEVMAIASVAELRLEGRKMRNCVGDDEKLAQHLSGVARAFSLRKGGFREATILLGFSGARWHFEDGNSYNHGPLSQAQLLLAEKLAARYAERQPEPHEDLLAGLLGESGTVARRAEAPPAETWPPEYDLPF